MPIVKFADVARHRKEFIRIDDCTKYVRARVQLHWRGIVERDRLEGAAIKTKEQQVAHTGELLVAEIDAKVGGIGIVPPELDGAVVSSHYFLFEIDEKQCLRKWLNHFIRSGALGDQVAARGSTNYAAIRPQHVLSFEMPLPPLPEQRRIVARIEELSAKIEEARELRQSSLEEIEHAVGAAKNNVFHSLKQHYTDLQINSFAQVKGGKRLPRGERLVENDTGYPYIRAGNLKDGTVKGEILFLPSEVQKVVAQYIVAAGDVYITIVGACIGDVGIIPEQFDGANLTENAAKITLNPKGGVDNKYLVYALGSPLIMEELLGRRTIAAQPKLALHRIRSTKVPIPELIEQRRIVSYLDDLQAKVDTVKKLQEESEQELNALMPSILSRAFAGEL